MPIDPKKVGFTLLPSPPAPRKEGEVSVIMDDLNGGGLIIINADSLPLTAKVYVDGVPFHQYDLEPNTKALALGDEWMIPKGAFILTLKPNLLDWVIEQKKGIRVYPDRAVEIKAEFFHECNLVLTKTVKVRWGK